MDVQLLKYWFLEEFVPSVEKFLRKGGLSKKALLLINNTPSHPGTTSLQCKDIIVKFLPPNTTSIVQSMDQGVIVFSKQNYQKNLL